MSRTKTFEDESGTATAEFAIALPAVLLVAVLVLGAVVLGGQQVRAIDASALAARAAGRGEDPAAAIAGIPDFRLVAVGSDGALVCVTVEYSAGAPALPALPVRARSCAASEGR